mgnify:CR=1 FL=1
MEVPASGFELWTVAMDCTVSLFILYLIGSLVFSCSKARGCQGYIAKGNLIEEPEEEQPVGTGGTSSGTQTDRTSVTTTCIHNYSQAITDYMAGYLLKTKYSGLAW